MTNSKSNRVIRMGIPFLFGMLLVVNCQTQSRSSGGGGSTGGSGCESPNSSHSDSTESQHWAITGTVVEYRNSVETRVPDVAITMTIVDPVAETRRTRTNVNGEYRVEFSASQGVVEVRPTKEGYRFDPETAAFAGSSNRAINFVASRPGV